METETTATTEKIATTETETTTINKQFPSVRERQQAHEYITPGAVLYLLSFQFISQNESLISII